MAKQVVFDRVWKRFHRGQDHDSLRDLIPALARRVAGRREKSSKSTREFWALQDLSFEVSPGEILGIIGPNGAGKSTTLKILNHIMDPTLGIVRCEGKIGALIEVSAGFHMDLTGRQNVFLQGAIMGMKKAEVTRKFEEIVAFAGIGDFIDTPVKRYSSGMNARLGFSIAAHLEPDILIIDEVLAVGDHTFQHRAFERIKAMANAGAPVVLVSHQLDRVAEMCTKAILLDRGRARAIGSPMECINEYLHGTSESLSQVRRDDIGIRFGELNIQSGPTAFSGEEVQIVFDGSVNEGAISPSCVLECRVIDTNSGARVHTVTDADRGLSLPMSGVFAYDLTLQMNVPPGRYIVEVALWDTHLRQDAASGPKATLEVLERMKFWGTVQMNAKWSMRT